MVSFIASERCRATVWSRETLRMNASLVLAPLRDYIVPALKPALAMGAERRASVESGGFEGESEEETDVDIVE